MTFFRPLPIMMGTLLLLSACRSQPDWTPVPDEPRAFVTTLGTDTIAVEVYTRETTNITGIHVDRIPYTKITEYAVSFDDLGNTTSLDATITVPATNPGGPAPQSVAIRVAGDVATVTREGGQNPGTSEVSVPQGVILSLGRNDAASFVFEQVAMHLRNGEQINLLGASNAAVRANASGVIDADTVFMDYFGQQRKAWTDAQGQLLGVTGKGTTNKSETRRVAPFLVGEMADRWAALDAAGSGLGTPSPGATANATVDGADIEIAYSQPAMRGREIWGGLVPNGEVWRTGANAATHFTTSRDLMFGEHMLAAGTYTLWSLYQDGAYSLIVNAQTNQWGTAYDAAQDLFSVPMTSRTLNAPQERFTISIEDTDGGGNLLLTWDTLSWSVPFMVH